MMADRAQVTAEEAYYVVLRTVVAGKQANWTVMSQMAQLRQLMGVSDDLHKQYMDQINSDPDVCAINGTPLPAPKRQRSTPQPAAGGSKSKGGAGGGSRPRPGGRISDSGMLLPPPVPIPTYGLQHRCAPHEDPHGLVGRRVNIVQEDDSTVEGMVVHFNAGDTSHYVIVNLGQPDEAGDALPLVEYPDAYQDLGPHPDYVSPIPPLAPVLASMPPPASRPRSSYSGAAGGGGPSKQRSKPPTMRGSGGGGGGGGGPPRLGQPPYAAPALDARLLVADLPELCSMLAAISRKERTIMAELEAAGLTDEALSRSVMEREELVRQISSH